jgi:hypothetical protein
VVFSEVMDLSRLIPGDASRRAARERVETAVVGLV